MKTKTENRSTPALIATAIFMMALVMSMGLTSAINANADERIDASINANTLTKIKAQVVEVAEDAISLDDAKQESELESEAEFNVKDTSSEIDISVSSHARETTFAQVSIGQGWATTEENGSTSGNFAKIFWVEKTFSEKSNQTTANETTKAIGNLRIGSDMYKLTLDSETNDSIVFDVVSQKKDVTGTLTLDSDVSMVGFTVWSGKLDLSSGHSYDIHVATKNSKIKGTGDAQIAAENKEKDTRDKTEDEDQPGFEGNLKASENGQGKKIGLWTRIRAFFGRD